MGQDSQAQEQLARHHRVWDAKPVLRRVYREEFFARLLAQRVAHGVSVEVGAGPGFLKEAANDIFSTDLICCPWLDAVVDAQRLPFRTTSVSNVLGLDVLHHLAAPMRFLEEVQRVLLSGGRLILVEPWITPFSHLLFRFFHQERCDLTEKPWLAASKDGVETKAAFDGNQAIPYLMFGRRQRQVTLGQLPGFVLRTLEPFCLFSYLLSGGFNHASLLPRRLYPAVAGFERVTTRLWRPLAALRVLLVLEKMKGAAG